MIFQILWYKKISFLNKCFFNLYHHCVQRYNRVIEIFLILIIFLNEYLSYELDRRHAVRSSSNEYFHFEYNAMTTMIYQNYILWKGDWYLRLYRPAQPSRSIVLQRYSFCLFKSKYRPPFLLKIDSSFSIRPTCRSYCHNQAQQPPLNPQLKSGTPNVCFAI